MSVVIFVTRDRCQPAPSMCTLGRLALHGRSYDTLEANTGGAFPPATYRVEPRTCDAFGPHWILANPQCGAYDDPSRGPMFLLRAGGSVGDLFSAMGIGKARHRQPTGEWVLRESRAAINELRTLLGGALGISLILQ